MLISNEVGHVHQLRPYFNWGGLGEVSNNVFSLYVTTSFGNPSRIAEQGNYQSARDSIINRGISFYRTKMCSIVWCRFGNYTFIFRKLQTTPTFIQICLRHFGNRASRSMHNGVVARVGGLPAEAIQQSTNSIL